MISKEKLSKYGEVSYKNKEILIRFIYGENMGRREIASFFNVSPDTIDYWRKKHKINYNGMFKTHRQFVREVYELVSCSYSVLSFYNKANDYVKVKHNKCGYIYNVKPSKFLTGRRCPKCFGNFLKTTTEYKEEIYKKTKGEFEIIGEYVDSHTKIKIRHNKCNYVFEKTPGDFSYHQPCDRCAKEKPWNKISDKDFRNKVVLTNKNYIFLERYKGLNKEILCQHNLCNFKFKTTPRDFFSVKGNCPVCNKNSKLVNTNAFKKKVEMITNGKYLVLSEYRGNKKQIELTHNKCGYNFKMTPDDFINGGNRCPICKSSKGESCIINWLISKKIEFKREHYFPNCISPRNGLFRFDFYLPEYNISIEYNGIQHLEYVEFFHRTEEEFKYRQKCDKIKETFCLDNDILLVKIPYWEKDNIPNRLENVLNNIQKYKNETKQYSLF